MNTIIELPKIFLARDYHDFDFFEQDIAVLKPKPKIRVKELGLWDHVYVGVVYTGRMPSIPVIQALLKKAKIELEEV